MNAPIYLDHAATSWPKAPGVAEAMARSLDTPIGNASRGAHTPAETARSIVEQCRTKLAQLVGVTADRLAILPGCTQALNAAILGFAEARREQRPVRIITTVLEHNAVRRPVEALRAAGRAEVRTLGCDRHARIDPEELADRCIEQPPDLVAVTHASNVFGAIQPIARLARTLREHAPDALLLVDAAQTVGLADTRLPVLGADLLAFGIHKGLRGPTGLGALAMSERVRTGSGGRPMISSTVFGGTGSDASSPGMPAELPTALETGSANIVAAAGALAAIGHHASGDRVALERPLEQLARVLSWADDAEGVAAPGPCAHERVPVATLYFDEHDPHEVAAILDGSFGIAVRAGLHCSPDAHAAFARAETGGVRIAIGSTNTDREIDALLQALEAITARASVPR